VLKTFTHLLGGVSLLAMGMGAGSVLAADPTVEERIEQAHTERVPSLTMGIYGAYSNIDNDEDSDALDSYPSLGGDFRLDIPLNDGFGIQFDFQGEEILKEGENTSEDYDRGYLGGIHVNYRDPESYLFGVFAAAGRVDTVDEDSGQARYHMAGVEGQYYMDNWTFYGQGGVGDLSDGSDQTDWMGDNWFARGAIKYYFNDGLGKLQGDVLFMNGEGSTEFDVWALGIEAEHHLADYSNGFITGFARFEQYYVEEDTGGGPDNGETQVIKIGIRMNLGYPNPMMRDRYGTAVDFADMSRVHIQARQIE